MQQLQAAGVIIRDFREGPDMDEAGLMQQLPEADAWLVSFYPITRALMEQAVRLKVIVKHGVGLDNIDIAAATQLGIQVRSAPGGTEHAVPEHALALLFSLARKIPQADAHVKSGQWGGKFMGAGLNGRTLGIVGLGRIGASLACKAIGFGMRIHGYDPMLETLPPALAHVTQVDWQTLLTESDFIVICAPLTPATEGLFSDEAFAVVKHGVLIINAARGGIVDEAALTMALENGRVGGYAADVFAEEPPRNRALIERPNVICTPHIASYSMDSLALMGQRAASGILDGLTGKTGEFLVNPDCLPNARQD